MPKESASVVHNNKRENSFKDKNFILFIFTFSPFVLVMMKLNLCSNTSVLFSDRKDFFLARTLFHCHQIFWLVHENLVIQAYIQICYSYIKLLQNQFFTGSNTVLVIPNFAIGLTFGRNRSISFEKIILSPDKSFKQIIVSQHYSPGVASHPLESL